MVPMGSVGSVELEEPLNRVRGIHLTPLGLVPPYSYSMKEVSGNPGGSDHPQDIVPMGVLGSMGLRELG